MVLGEELRKARIEAELSQEKLAFKADLDRTYVSHLENGHKSPTVETLMRVCGALGVSASVLIAAVERSIESRRR